MRHRSLVAAPLACAAVLMLAPMAAAGPPVPPPDSTALRYLQHVRICPQGFCDLRLVRPICPGDSIEVRLDGAFPNNCFTLRRVELLPDRSMSPIPHPPIVRVVVDDQGCVLPLCRPIMTPWSASVTMPPLRGGGYSLALQVVQVTCTDTVPPGVYPAAYFPFGVADSCPTLPPPPIGCLLGGFSPGPTANGCNAVLDPATRTATVGVTVRSMSPLAGLQGEFSIDQLGWVIDSIQTTGPATGMHLTWTRVGRGARFVMFTDRGMVIPPTGEFEQPPEVLRLTIRQMRDNGTQTPADITQSGMLGSDPNGLGIDSCPTFTAITARVCVESQTCDANEDGRIDVRDLVRMAHCLHDSACADSARFDCNRDAHFDLDDVLCCARNILHPPLCRGCPPDTTGQTAPNVRLGWGAPRETRDGIEVPIRLEGAESVGAARWTLRAPLDRYELVSLDREYGDPAWLPLTDASSGELAVGLLYLGADGPGVAPQEAGFVLKLRLRDGQAAGGSLDPVGQDFSGRDGARLLVQSSSQSVSLPGTAALLLSEVRPQPFRGTTRFSITLASDARVDLGVFDIGGRRIRTVHRGPLSLGTHDFSWDGRTDSGERSRGGIYFLRATIGGVAVTRRMVLLSSD